jgi:hypothetical protein
MWYILGIIALIFLIFNFWQGRNAVWGGFTLGIIGGIIVAIISVLFGNDFDFSIIWKGMIVGTLIGVIAELLGIISDKFS